MDGIADVIWSNILILIVKLKLNDNYYGMKTHIFSLKENEYNLANSLLSSIIETYKFNVNIY